jgi:tyrosine-protein kinase Etk/Wzc
MNHESNGPDLPARGMEPPVPALRREGPPPGEYQDGFRARGSSGFEWERYVSSVRRYKWIILLIALVGTASGLAAAYLVDPQYQAQATLWVESRDRMPQGDHGPIQAGNLLESFNWVELLKSYAVLEHVAREMNLYLRPANPADSELFSSFDTSREYEPGSYLLTLSDDGRDWTLQAGDSAVVEQGAVGDSIGRAVGFRWAPSAAQLIGSTPVEFRLQHPRDAARDLRDDLDTWMLEDGNFLKIELRGKDPERTEAIVNAVAQRFATLASDLKRAKVDQLTELLEGQLETAEARLDGAEADLEGFRVRTVDQPSWSAARGGSEQSAGPATLANRYQNMQFEIDDVRSDQRMIESALQRAASGDLPVEFLLTVPAVQQSTVLNSAIQELYQKRAELRALLQMYTPEHQDVQQLQAEVDELDEATVPNLARNLSGQLAARRGALQEEVASMSSTMRRIPARATEEARLERTLYISEGVYSNLKARAEEARLAQASTISDVQVLDPAEVGRQPISDDGAKMVVMALLGSLGLALVGILVFDRFDPRVRYPEHVSEGMGMRILGTIPHLKTKKGHIAADQAGAVTEAFRTLRLNLAHAHGAAGPLMTTITSPSPGDGKSFVSLNLALTYARLGRRTLLIDGDTRKGRLHRALNRPRKPGLTDFLSNGTSVAQVIRKTEHESLDFISGGTTLSSGPELLQSARMRDLIALARSEYDAIIVDSPPLAAGVDPLVLATFSGSMVLVLRSGATKRALAEAKLDLMTPLPIRVLGAVLNDISASETYYDYYGTYTRGYEARDEVLEDASAKLLTTSNGKRG